MKIREKTVAEQRTEIFYKCVYLALCTFLILLDTAVGKIAFVTFGITAIAVFFGRDDFVMLNMVYLMPFALIFKPSASATSFYTYLFLLYVAKQLIYGNKFSGYLFIFFVYLVAVQFLMHTFNALRSIKLFANILFVYYAFRERDKYKKTDLYIAYIIGFTLASLIAFMNSNVFRIELYIGEIDYVGDKVRYSGLNPDCNFYSVNVVTALCLLIVLYQKKKLPNILLGGIAAILVFCAISTYSKSVLIMLVFPVYLFWWMNKKENKIVMQVIMVAAVIFFIVNLLAGKIDALSTVLGRLEKGGGDLDALTTGRTRLWRIYLEYYSRHPFTTLFGFGLGSGLVLSGKASHNTYIDMIYYIGIVGEIWMFITVNSLSKERRDLTYKRQIINYSINIVIAIMYFFLPGLFDHQLPILLLLGFLLLEGDAKPLSLVERIGMEKRNNVRKRRTFEDRSGDEYKEKWGAMNY